MFVCTYERAYAFPDHWVSLCGVQADTLEAELRALREDGAGGVFHAMPLPDGMSVTSSDVIASLNEHLVQVMQVRVEHCSRGRSINKLRNRTITEPHRLKIGHSGSLFASSVSLNCFAGVVSERRHDWQDGGFS